MANRFVSTEPTLQELLYVQRCSRGDFESVILLLESRIIDKKFDIRGLPMSALIPTVIEMCEAMGIPSEDLGIKAVEENSESSDDEILM